MPDSSTTPQTGMNTELYQDELFSAMIPQGWQTRVVTWDGGTGERIAVFVQDPSDGNNLLFFMIALEPFFTSVDAKNAMLPYITDASFQWSPVLEELSAAALLQQWGAIYTMLDMQGFDSGFANYSVQQIIASNIAENATPEDTASNVEATVSIPNASSYYRMYLTNEFVKMTLPAPIYADYYVSYGSMGLVVREDQADSYAQTLVSCLNSFNFDGFTSKYGSGALQYGQ